MKEIKINFLCYKEAIEFINFIDNYGITNDANRVFIRQQEDRTKAYSYYCEVNKHMIGAIRMKVLSVYRWDDANTTYTSMLGKILANIDDSLLNLCFKDE